MRINWIVSFLFFISFLIVQGCKSLNSDEYYNSIMTRNYDNFKGKFLFIRDYDNGNPIVFLFDYSKSYQPCASLIFTADVKNYKILESRVLKYDDTCNLLITQKDIQLLHSFLKLDFIRLMVKDNGNIYISTLSPQHLDVVKILVEDDNAIEYINWTKFPDHWFVKPGE